MMNVPRARERINLQLLLNKFRPWLKLRLMQLTCMCYIISRYNLLSQQANTYIRAWDCKIRVRIRNCKTVTAATRSD